jgi:protein arginine kinase activator
MRCERCGEREAAIHLTQIVNGVVTALHLCEACAAAKGVEAAAAPATFPLGDFLATLGQAAAGAPEPAVAACSGCGAGLQDFRDTGRLGCARCWDAFAPQLRELLRRLHGSAVHVGEGYAPGAGTVAPLPALAPTEQLTVLRRQLQQAVAAEDFERAAALRDRIRELECST